MRVAYPVLNLDLLVFVGEFRLCRNLLFLYAVGFVFIKFLSQPLPFILRLKVRLLRVIILFRCLSHSIFQFHNMCLLPFSQLNLRRQRF